MKKGVNSGAEELPMIDFKWKGVNSDADEVFDKPSHHYSVLWTVGKGEESHEVICGAVIKIRRMEFHYSIYLGRGCQSNSPKIVKKVLKQHRTKSRL